MYIIHGDIHIQIGDVVNVLVRVNDKTLGLVAGVRRNFLVSDIDDGELVTIISGRKVYLTGTKWFSEVSFDPPSGPSCI
jgi:ribosomal protein L13